MKRIVALMLVVAFVLPVFGQEDVDLSGVKAYLTDHVAQLDAEAGKQTAAAQAYYALAEAAGFDYEALWANNRVEVISTLATVKDAWLVANPLYEKVEGIVAGVPSLSEFDVILDAGASGEEDPEGGVPFDLVLTDGTVLSRPGNLFSVLEGALWGGNEAYTSGVSADFNLNSEADFGELLPDALVLLAAAEKTSEYTAELVAAADAWEPNATDAFTALVVMVPTMSEYFGSWRDSRFVLGDASAQSDFSVISRLSDIRDILGGLIVVYDGVTPLIVAADSAQADQIRSDLVDLQAYVLDLLAQENDGRQFTPEEADIFGTEAQDRAQAITGQIAQVAALAGIVLPEE